MSPLYVELCNNCIYFDANGWDLEDEPLPDPAPMSLLTGYLIGPDERDHTCEGHFSWAPCQGCGETLGGDRWCYEAVKADCS